MRILTLAFCYLISFHISGQSFIRNEAIYSLNRAASSSIWICPAQLKYNESFSGEISFEQAYFINEFKSFSASIAIPVNKNHLFLGMQGKKYLELNRYSFYAGGQINLGKSISFA
ncbi:MAG: hypothetical protein AAGK97_13890, partial [Bacteroidota bacterium]